VPYNLSSVVGRSPQGYQAVGGIAFMGKLAIMSECGWQIFAMGLIMDM